MFYFSDPPSPPIVGVADVTSSSVGIHWKTTDNKQPSVVRKLINLLTLKLLMSVFSSFVE